MATIYQDRRALIDSAAARWAKDLIDLDFRNTLLRFRGTKTTTLDLTNAEPAALTRLLSGNRVRLGRLYPDEDARDTALKAARNLHRNTLLLAEEQGIDAGRVAVGLLNGPPPRGRAATGTGRLRAPLVLRSMTLHVKGRGAEDFEFQADAESEVNPVLLYALGQQYGLDLSDTDAEKLSAMLQEISDPREQAQWVFDELAAIAARQEIGLSHEDHVVAGIFSYEKLPMVQDLRNAGDLLAGHDLVAAIAGDADAARALASDGPYEPAIDHDRLPPREDFLVRDADSSQQRAIDVALAGRHLVIDGPPGTGKSQTIANLIASMAARGKRVLFVAEKRAAIEAVTEGLAEVGLDKLVFDLHHDRLKRREIARQMAAALDDARSVLKPTTGENDRRLTRSRERLAAHDEGMHRRREPWGVTVFELLDTLAGLPADARSELRFRGDVLTGLDTETYREVVDLLAEFVDHDGLRIWRGESPWSGSRVHDPGEVEQVLATLDELATTTLRSTRADLVALVRGLGLPAPDNLAGWTDVLTLLNDVTTTLSRFQREVFGPELDDLQYATGTRSWRRTQSRRIGFWRRRALVRRARELRKGSLRDRAALHAELTGAVQQRDTWLRWSTARTTPSAVPDIDHHLALLRRVQVELAAVAACARLPDLASSRDHELDDRLRALRDGRDDLVRMPEINRVRDRLGRLGLAPLVNELAGRYVDADGAKAVFTYAWATSVLEQVKIHSPGLAGFTGPAQERTVREFQESDVAHRKLNIDRVRRAVAEGLRQASDTHPDQAQTVKRQAAMKTRHMALRTLVDKAPDILLSAFPCWAMSPLNVSRTLPPQRLFDVVIFDEASQVEPQDAIASIMRGAQIVVAGDDRQLPPSSFFRRRLAGDVDWDDDGDDEEDTGDLRAFESILDRMKALVPDRERLCWHYRSRDERLIAFSNAEIYDRDLVTFPGVLDDSPLSFEPVEGTALPGQGSSAYEVQRVVELVQEHARSRPDVTLGVITLGSKHQERVEMALNDVMRTDDALAAFCSDEKGPGRRFFVKNLERVQGDEREAIILSMGYAKRPSGAMPALGPLSHRDGERRLNVAVTRARTRMTVVSSFTHHDLNPARAAHRGPELLRRFLDFASRTDAERPSDRATDVAMNDFEREVCSAMRAAGIPVHPQWGSSGYRIDFALAHPRQPGRMVLAVETDGERYHRSASARDRDRLRQHHLQDLGWRFHRLWALDWSRDRDNELTRIVQAWHAAVEDADPTPLVPEPAHAPARPAEPAEPVQPVGRDRGPRPEIPRGLKIDEYTGQQLTWLCLWLMSDGLPLDRETRVRQALTELGFQKRGRRIGERLDAAVKRAQQRLEIQGDA